MLSERSDAERFHLLRVISFLSRPESLGCFDNRIDLRHTLCQCATADDQ